MVFFEAMWKSPDASTFFVDIKVSFQDTILPYYNIYIICILLFVFVAYDIIFRMLLLLLRTTFTFLGVLNIIVMSSIGVFFWFLAIFPPW